MIDWFYVLSHGLWVLGVAVCVAAVSYRDWRRRDPATCLLAHQTGLLLIAIGLLLTPAQPLWVRGICLALAGGAAGALWLGLRSDRGRCGP